MFRKIRDLFSRYAIDGYIVPKNDIYFSEYSHPDYLKYVSNFDGSFGLAIILKNYNYLFVDGRYTQQAKIQSGKNYKIYEIPKILPYNLFNKLDDKITLGFDPKLFTTLRIKNFFSNSCYLKPLEENLTKKIYKKNTKYKLNSFFSLSSIDAGENVKSKILRLKSVLKENKIDLLYVSAPENVSWLLNIRGNDEKFSPIANCRLLFSTKGKLILLSEKKKIRKIKKENLYRNIIFEENNNFFKTIRKLSDKTLCLDSSSCSIFDEAILGSKFKIINYEDPIYKMKSIKNSKEINNTINSHIIDGVALTKFIYWVKHIKKNVDELSAQRKLEYFRKKNKKYLYPSFHTIMGSGPNGAIIHYKSTKKTNRKIKHNDLLLCDSGGQYLYGTTDVTRTICFKKQSNKLKEIYTRVLKGHIAVILSNLNKIKSCDLIDARARKYLNDVNLNYAHGTGHGVGYFLNVHEGPISISKNNPFQIKEGMILSNEPGYYKNKKYGIRIENLIYSKKQKNKLSFKNLTYVPLETDLIDYKLLNQDEKNYIKKYHSEVYSKISKYLNINEKYWLQTLF